MLWEQNITKLTFFFRYICVCVECWWQNFIAKKEHSGNIKKVMNVRLPRKECFSNPILKSIVNSCWELKSDFFFFKFPKKNSIKLKSKFSFPFFGSAWKALSYREGLHWNFPNPDQSSQDSKRNGVTWKGFKWEAVQEDKNDLDAIGRDLNLKIETYASRLLNFNIRKIFLPF